MKFLIKLLLVILYVPVFLIFIFAVNLRFQLLTPSFWDKSFSSESTYSKLSVSINKNLESQTIAEGGTKGDVRILTDLITPENIKDTISKNINNLLLYANGKANDLNVYIPVNKIPESLLSNNFNKVQTEMSLTELLKDFNVQGISASQIQLISRAGYISWLGFIISSILVVLLLGLLYIFVGVGKRLVAPGMVLVISGITALLVTGAGTIIRINWTKDLAGSPNMGDSIIGIVAPPIVQGLLNVWLYFAAASLILGFALFFVKKPVKK